MVRRQKATLSIPLLSIPPSTIITIRDVSEPATTAPVMGSTAPAACSAAPQHSRLKRGGTHTITEHAGDNAAPALPGEGLDCRRKQLFPDTGAAQTQQKAQAAREV